LKNLAPQTLSAEARRWWRALVREYQIVDEGGLLLLQTALEAFDEVKTCQKQIRQEGRTLSDRFGQIKPHRCPTRLARSWLLQELGRAPAHDSRDLSEIDSRSSSFT